ncbi:MAG: helix-turn-helix domain-containing protein [Bacillati bacterium ANGP1]|uniref:Helix-turn-helix domain-containing protein n=1 Tax=Candidatus Segetimicrobium genomatis TaxID=2569760 RepID=A0A537IYT0_9BACT|nr:MAG: helix-turn-helix domain-containing protein [Terrabacteria group bacterium ANGP1]
MPRSSVGNGGPPDQGVSPEPELLTVEQAAAYLQMHKVTVYKYIRAGLLPAARLGKVYRIYRKDVEALLQRLRAEKR